jgi:hypothetical protein
MTVELLDGGLLCGPNQGDEDNKVVCDTLVDDVALSFIATTRRVALFPK